MRKWKPILWRFLLAFGIMLFALIAVLEYTHYRSYGHLFLSYDPHVEVLSKDYSISIPGQIKVYRAKLTNYSFWPMKLTACDFITDTLASGTEFPYAIQRWDAETKNWQTIVEPNEENFCHPYPLGQSNTRRVSKWLWPGMSVEVMDFEATGAREPFRYGDMARFVVFRRIGEQPDWSTAMPSAPFVIEDDVKSKPGDFSRTN